MKKSICILFGGKSQEHEVSLQSAASICHHIDTSMFSVIAIGIDHAGTWHLQEELTTTSDPARGSLLCIQKQVEPVSVIPGQGLFYKGKKLAIDIVFPVLHGSFGEDGTLQGFLEMLDLPYVGAGVLGSSLSIDKEKVKRIWREQGLPVVDFFCVHKNDLSDEKKIINDIEKCFSYPVFVKPASTGSSVGVSKVKRREELIPAINDAFRYDVKLLVERAVDAREIECAVIGNDRPKAFPPGEVIPSHEFYSYQAKYLDPLGAKFVIPALIPEATAARVMELAVRACQGAGVEGLARVDMFLDRRTEALYVNEINTIPGFTNISMFPRMCEAGGLAYRELIRTLIEYGLQRFSARSTLGYKH